MIPILRNPLKPNNLTIQFKIKPTNAPLSIGRSMANKFTTCTSLLLLGIHQ